MEKADADGEEDARSAPPKKKESIGGTLSLAVECQVLCGILFVNCTCIQFRSETSGGGAGFVVAKHHNSERKVECCVDAMYMRTFTVDHGEQV